MLTTEETINPILKLTKDLKAASRLLTPREARYLVDLYYQIQEYRKRAGNQDRAGTEEHDPNELIGWIFDQMHTLERNIKNAMNAYSDSQVVGRWAKSIHGIGPVISAGLLAHIDLNPWRCVNSGKGWDDGDTPLKTCKPDTPCTASCRHEQINTVGKIWRFAGLDPTDRWEKGKVRPWNAKLKTLCWKIGESFVKVKGSDKDFYGHLYETRKEIEIEKNDAGNYLDQAESILKNKKIGKDTDAIKYYQQGKLPPGHLHSRSKRWAVKMFLSHWHWVAYETKYHEKPPYPFVIEHLGHKDFTAPPNWPMK